MEGCKELTSLNLSFCLGVMDEGLDAIGNGCKQLTSLSVGGFRPKVTAEGAAGCARRCPRARCNGTPD